MPLTDKQKKHIENNFIKHIYGPQHLEQFVKSGKILSWEEFEGYDENLVQTLKKIIGTRPDPEEEAEWRSIVSQLDKPSEELRSLLQAYISHWQTSQPHGHHLEEAQTHLNGLDNKLEEEEWNSITPLFETPDEELRIRLQAFLSHWPNSSHQEEAYAALAGIDQQMEMNEWEYLNKMSIPAMIDYLTKYPYSTHLNEIDDAVWNILAPYNNSVDLRERLEQYRYYFPNGIHMMEAYNIVSSLDEWADVKSSEDLKKTNDYIKMHPDSPFFNDARVNFFELKKRELEKMKREFNEYDYNNLLFYLNEKIFSENDLIEHGVATKESIEILKRIEEVKDRLPNIDDVITKCQPICYENNTDIYLFGIPGTGKSCVLAGMVSAKATPLSYNSVLSGGRYADAMVQYLTQGIPPPPTRINYLTTIKGDITDSKGQMHNINLVEMAGEEFAFHIADNDRNEITFEDMGTGVTDLLTNDNRKVFFIVVDPTKLNIKFNKVFLVQDERGEIVTDTRTVTVNQHECLKRLIDLFRLPENEKILKNVEAIHFIITKADMFKCQPHERDQYAVNFFTKEYYNIFQSLTALCREHGINSNKKNKALDGIPKLYTFSLGKFYVGNIVEFNDNDSLKIINAIINYTTSVTKKSFWDKVKNLFNGGN